MRAMKERYGMSDMRKQANRVGFNVAEDEIGYEGEGLGLLGKSAGRRALTVSSDSREEDKDR